ncbi:MAG: RNase adapter RapZ [Gammaproteobacteria bacterium]|nr:MAG: RNase adapter RapZ [Gammaproteobacteria bacterium]
MNLTIITGLSGSGKSVALSALEDLDYYCTDNLPASMLASFGKELNAIHSGEGGEIAVSIDSRNRQFLENLPLHLQQLDKINLPYSIIFLEADENELLTRFNQTRRKHPLSSDTVSLREAIQLEKQLLEPLSARASKRINTTNTTLYELRGIIRDIAGAAGASKISLLIESFGFKHSTPRDADFVFDVRCLPNPYWNKSLAHQTGKDAAVIAFFRDKPEVDEMIGDIHRFLSRWLKDFEKEQRSYITVAIGCTGGQHRSVYVADQLFERLAGKDLNLQIRHRQL